MADIHVDFTNGNDSTGDGRNPITGANATNVITRLQEKITDYESGGNAKLNTINVVAVNRS